MSAAKDIATGIISPARRRLGVDEETIAFLATVSKPPDVDLSLLTGAPAADVAKTLQQLVVRLQKLSIESVLRKQGLLSQFTGADIEAKLRFEQNVLSVSEVVEGLAGTHRGIEKTRSSVALARAQLIKSQERLRKVIKAATFALNASRSTDRLMVDRYRRRLSTLITLEVSNTLTIEQLNFAEQNAKSLMDRINDIILVVFPLWQRNALALAHAPEPLRQESDLLARFRDSQRILMGKLHLGEP